MSYNNVHDNVRAFEQEMANFCGSKYAIAVDCCTHAIFLCLQYLKSMGKLPETITCPDRTYIGVPAMIKQCGSNVKFVEDPWIGLYQLGPHRIYDCACCLEQDMFNTHDMLFGCLSFHYKKPIPIGKGGMILTDNYVANKWLTQARYVGRRGDLYNEPTNISVLGWHMYMTPEQATRGLELFYSMDKSLTKITGQYSDKYSLSQYDIFK